MSLILSLVEDQIISSFTYTSTNTPVQYTNWAMNSLNDAPDNSDNSEDCAIIKGSQWDEICCETGNVAKVVCEEVHQPNCDTDDPSYHTIQGRCFYFGNTKSSYQNAEIDCADKGGRLFEPKNEEANLRIYQNARSFFGIPFWIGINGRSSPGK